MTGQWHFVPCDAPSSWETPAPDPGGRRGVERGRHILGEPVGTGSAVTLRMLHWAGRSASRAGRS